MRSKSPSPGLFRSGPTDDGPDAADLQDGEERPRFTSRGTFNPEKGKQKLRGAKYSPLRHREPPEGGGHHKREPDLQPQQLVLYGTNEFMV